MIDFRQVNSVAKGGGIVFLGSTYLSSVPVCELAQDFGTRVPVHNRSVEGVKIDQVGGLLEGCVYDLSPSKIFICLGDEDIKDEAFDTDSFIDRYQWLLYTLHSKCRAEIFIMPVMSDGPAARRVNERLRDLAAETGCRYVDFCAACGDSHIRLFDALRVHMRPYPISFAEAMSFGR